jgi:hypothetical protein
MSRTIQPVGRAKNKWTQWYSPIDIRQQEIPPCPGVYQLAAFCGRPLYTPKNPPRIISKEDSDVFEKIVYTGKAVCLQERFWLLVQSWQRSGSPTCHGSRKSYNSNHLNCQQHFQLQNVKCRWKQIGSTNWLQCRQTLKNFESPQTPISDAVKVIWCESGKPQKMSCCPSWTDAPSTVTATFSEESSLLRKFHCIFGCLPLLNKRPPESLGPKPDKKLIWEWVTAEEFAFESIPHEDGICFRAFERWRERGCPNNDDWTDWFAAELELWERIILEN